MSGSRCRNEIKRYWLILGLALMILALEILGGLISGSLALLSDAGHVLVDAGAIATSIFIAYLSRANAAEKKIRAQGARLNAGLLGILALWIFWEASERFRTPREILNGVMFGVAVAGAILNYLQHRILETADQDDRHLTHQAIDIHVLSDLGQSLAVVIASILIWLTGKTIIDPILSLLVAAIMLGWAVRLFQKSYQ